MDNPQSDTCTTEDDVVVQVVGFVIIGFAILALIWNEVTTSHLRLDLREAVGMVVSTVPNYANPALERELVHVKGKLEDVFSAVSDPVFGIRKLEALKLRRRVEVYQWIEEKKTVEKTNKDGDKIGEITTYSYDKQWRTHIVDSSTFKKPHMHVHENPSEMRFEQLEVTADPIKLGAFVVSPDLLNLDQWEMEDFSDFRVEDIPDPTLRYHAKKTNNQLYFSGEKEWQHSQGNPKIGDCRVTYQIIPEQTVTLVAKQIGNTLQTYEAPRLGPLPMIGKGEYEALEMFEMTLEDKEAETICMRIGCTLALVIGYLMAFYWLEDSTIHILSVSIISCVSVLSFKLLDGQASPSYVREQNSLRRLHQQNAKRFLGYESAPSAPAESECLEQQQIKPTAPMEQVVSSLHNKQSDAATICNDVLQAEPLLPPTQT